MRTMRSLAAGLAVAAVATTSGCGYEGLNSFTLPGTEGGGGYTVQIELANAMDLVPNSPVLVDDLKAGSVTSIELQDYRALVTVQIRDDVELPANSVAKVGQTSLLGAKHVEINAPEDAEPQGRLVEGAVLPLEQTGVYPSTEDVLASVSALLNGGGVAQIKTITTELNRALGGRADAVRTLLDQADTFTASLDAQKSDITHAVDSLNRIGSSYAAGNGTITAALESLPPALEVLGQEREKLVSALEAVGEFGVEGDDLIGRAGDDLVANIANLVPVAAELAKTGDDLGDYLEKLPGAAFFPVTNYDQYLRGDYINISGTIDLGLDNLDAGFLTGTPLEGVLGGANGLLGQVLGGNSNALGDPLTDLLGVAGGSSASSPPDAGTAAEDAPAAPAAPVVPPQPAATLGDFISMLLGGGAR